MQNTAEASAGTTDTEAEYIDSPELAKQLGDEASFKLWGISTDTIGRFGIGIAGIETVSPIEALGYKIVRIAEHHTALVDEELASNQTLEP